MCQLRVHFRTYFPCSAPGAQLSKQNLDIKGMRFRRVPIKIGGSPYSVSDV